jgi:hypothetical protein
VTTSPRNGSAGGGPTPDYGGDTPMSLHDMQSTPGLNLLDLELLHNYVTSTANTLHTDPALKTLWKINVSLGSIPSASSHLDAHISLNNCNRRHFSLTEGELS